MALEGQMAQASRELGSLVKEERQRKVNACS